MLDSTFSSSAEEARKAWTEAVDRRYGGTSFDHVNRSGVTVRPVYDATDLRAAGLTAAEPGQFPYDRGIYPIHYQHQPWMDLQIIGYGVASQLRERMDLLKAADGAKGYFGGEAYNLIFDMPTSMGYDPDTPGVGGAIGDCGVSIVKASDFETLFAGKDLARTHVSMVCNAGSPAMLALYLAAARRMGVSGDRLAGNITNYIWDFFGHCGGVNFSPRGSYRLCVDVAAYCAEHAPRFNTVTVSEHNICEAGANHVQALAFSMATIVALNEEAVSLGIDPDTLLPRYGFHVRYGEDFFEDVAKTRALRRMYARINSERFGATRTGSLTARIHAQTAGSLLTVQQPLNNLVRNAYGALSAVMAGVNGMTINAYDEALGIPTEEAVTLSLRTSQILAEETGAAKVTDPLAGSYYVESLTSEIEAAAQVLLDEIDRQGGLVACIESGWVQAQVAESAYRWRQEVESGERVLVGVNKHTTDEPDQTRVFRPDPATAQLALEDLRRHRAERDEARTRAALADLLAAATAVNEGREIGSCTAALVASADADATLGEMQAVLFSVFGRNK
ncbi:methylmalonyl-CoA mutase family protein [Nocardioides sp. AN3]